MLAERRHYALWLQERLARLEAAEEEEAADEAHVGAGAAARAPAIRSPGDVAAHEQWKAQRASGGGAVGASGSMGDGGGTSGEEQSVAVGAGGGAGHAAAEFKLGEVVERAAAPPSMPQLGDKKKPLGSKFARR